MKSDFLRTTSLKSQIAYYTYQVAEFQPTPEPSAEDLSNFEHLLGDEATYPLGDTRFRVDHGRDYLGFFRRIGDTVLYRTARDPSAGGSGGGQGGIVGTACALLRNVPGDSSGDKAWYIGDLRVAPSHRGRHLTEEMFSPIVEPMLKRCGSAFAVEMVPTPDAPGRMPRLVQACRPDLPVAVCRLELWSLSATAVRRQWSEISKPHGGPEHATFLDLSGVKDLRLVDSGEALRVLHLIDRRSLKPGDRESPEPEEGARHLLCSASDGMSGSGLGDVLRANGNTPFAYALAVHVGLDGVMWESLSTAEI